MNLPQPILRRLSVLVFSLVIWAGAHGIARAEDGGGAGAYVLPYAIVIVCIAAGVYVVTRSSRREEPAKAGPIEVGEILPGQHAPKEPSRRAAMTRHREQSKDAKNALVLGLAGIVLFGIPGVIAIIKGIQARKAILQNPRLTGEQLAVGGIIAGAVAIVVWLVIVVVTLMNMMG